MRRCVESCRGWIGSSAAVRAIVYSRIIDGCSVRPSYVAFRILEIAPGHSTGDFWIIDRHEFISLKIQTKNQDELWWKKKKKKHNNKKQYKNSYYHVRISPCRICPRGIFEALIDAGSLFAGISLLKSVFFRVTFRADRRNKWNFSPDHFHRLNNFN